MRKTKFSKRREIEAKIRNKLTMPLVVLNSFLEGKRVLKKNVRLAIKDINKILELLDRK